MPTTLLVVICTAAYILFCASCWAYLSWLGQRWIGHSKASLLASFSIVACIVIVQLLSGLGLLILGMFDLTIPNFQMLNPFVLPMLIPTAVVWIAYRREIKPLLCALAAIIVTTSIHFCIATFVVKPYLFEAYVGNGLAMAPTIVGAHFRTQCPECGQDAYLSTNDRKSTGLVSEDIRETICSRFHTTKVKFIETNQQKPDRVLALKFLAPRRWDIVAYLSPADGATVVGRVVGLPNESVHFEDGEVFINDTKVPFPDAMKNCRYLSVPKSIDSSVRFSKDDPAVLAEGEYFVLGDNSYRSFDSRYWQNSSASHPDYALPEKNLLGIITHRYWPIDRITCFR